MAIVADAETINKFYAGPKLWNDWIELNVKKQISFDRHDFEENELSGRIINNAYFSGSEITDHSTVNAAFQKCIFVGCDFSGAILASGFSDSFFIDVNFSNAEFVDVSFRNCLFSNCNFDGSTSEELAFFHNSFVRTKISTIEGLETVLFYDRQSLDFETIRLSWPLGNNFLRQCGLADNLIDYLPSLMNQPIQFYSCFISYADKNREFVDRLYNDMQGAGVRVWYAPEDLKTGDKLHPTFDHAIRLHDKLLIILSEQSLASPWVEDEVNRALAKERERKRKGDDSPVLFPIMIDDAVMDSQESWATYIKENRHIGDFRQWKDHDSYRTAFDRLMRDLKPAIMRMPGA